MSKYSEEFKLKIVKEHKETHIGAKSLQRKYGVHHSQIEQWIKKKLKNILIKVLIITMKKILLFVILLEIFTKTKEIMKWL